VNGRRRVIKAGGEGEQSGDDRSAAGDRGLKGAPDSHINGSQTNA
jgi:hypothetical protein